MSEPRQPPPSKLFLSAIYSDREAADKALASFMEKYGPSDFNTREMHFKQTLYYGAEMGEPLLRRLFTFRDLVEPSALPSIKLFTNALEREAALEGKRTVNLDPGLLSIGNFILATGKPVFHRPYLGSGIYADLTLIYQSGSFQALAWTYPDYADPEMISWLNRVRESYKADLRRSRDE